MNVYTLFSIVAGSTNIMGIKKAQTLPYILPGLQQPLISYG